MARLSPLVMLPPAIFAGLAAMFFWGMQRENPDELRSVFIGKPAPALPQEGLADFPRLTDADLRSGELTIVNFWASWCPPCRAEHPRLLEMQAEGLRVAGVNFKDREGDATDYLGDEGNPFFGIAFDPAGRYAIDWGVTAPPETFIVDGDGTILFKFVGPLVGSDYEQRFLPALEDARAKAGN
ncbi:DsbE family thiol:disulfide interchange protein [Ostreiculturibacter nitratireducens]|uniref:DsbE family thiol:disulfide interchange protein n=1 Tax=Ostreiculturibacter nitratireducens TaxID=3075226 RepID=UPI0031B5F2EB